MTVPLQRCRDVIYPDDKVHGANMGPIWGRPHVGPMNFAIWVIASTNHIVEPASCRETPQALWSNDIQTSATERRESPWCQLCRQCDGTTCCHNGITTILGSQWLFAFVYKGYSLLIYIYVYINFSFQIRDDLPLHDETSRALYFCRKEIVAPFRWFLKIVSSSNTISMA